MTWVKCTLKPIKSPIIRNQQTLFRFSWPLLAFLVVTLMVLFSGERPLLDGDTYMHIGIGRWILEHHTVPKVDVFSHTMAGQPWMAHEWLAEVILALVYEYGSWTGLVLLAALCTAATLSVSLQFMLKRVIPLYAIGFAALTYLALLTHLLARPHVLTWPLIVLWFSALLSAVEFQRRPPSWLLIIMVFWVNLHGGFVLGFALLGPLAVEAYLHAATNQRLRVVKEWGLFAAAAILVSFINPAGWEAYRFLFHLMGNEYLTKISEWQPTDLSKYGALEVWIYFLIIIGLTGMLKLPSLRLVFLLLLLCQALAHVRYVSIFALLAPLLIARDFGQSYAIWQRQNYPDPRESAGLTRWFDDLFDRLNVVSGWGAKGVSVVLVIIAAFFCLVYQTNQPAADTVPKGAIDAAFAANLEGNLFNHDGSGGYLILRGIPVFTDGRADLYGEQFMREQNEFLASTDANQVRKRLDFLNVDWVLMPISSNIVNQINELSNWEKFYTDSHAVIYKRVKMKRNVLDR